MRRKRARGGAKLVEAVGECREAAEARGAGLEDRVDDREQEERVGAGPDEVVLVGDRGRLGAARVDQHDAAAARADRLDPRADPRRGHDAAVGGQRVRAHD